MTCSSSYLIPRTLTYTAGSGGSLSGSTTQTVNDGSNGAAVIAVPHTGYQFTSWSDHSTQNPRTDTDITHDISVEALFTATSVPPVVPPLPGGGGGGGGGSVAASCTAPEVWSSQTLGCQLPGTLNACHDPKALNYNPGGTADNALCNYTTGAPLTLTGQPTPVTVADCPFFTYANVGSKGPNVTRIQTFLNQYVNAKLTLDGSYGPATKKAVETFQALYPTYILNPWGSGLSAPTGRFYKTTAGVANIIVGCPAESVYLEGKGEDTFSGFLKK